MCIAYREVSNQPEHLPSLIFLNGWIPKDHNFLQVDREYTDQTGRLPSLI